MRVITRYRLNRSLRYALFAAFLGGVSGFVTNQKLSIFPVLAGAVFGLILGLVEVFLFEKRLRKFGIPTQALIRLAIINVVAIGVVLGFGYVIDSLDLETPVSNDYPSLLAFVHSPDLLFVLLNINIISSLIIAYFQLEILVGRDHIWNYISGRYNQPQQEERIFMFLDLKSSTTLAERMGNEHYYSWLNQFFYDLTVPTLETKAEIYQYVGDEVVFTWKARSGIRKNRCLELFYRIKDVVRKHAVMYEEKFGEVPVFKAGMHVGMAVSAEVGYLKKSIVYSGDVLNATARIQSLCNKHEAELLVSQQLADRLNLKDYRVQSLGTVALRGREESLDLVKVEPPSTQ